MLSGPSHAEEMSRGLPTSVVAASHDMRTGPLVQTAVQHRPLPRLHEPRSDRRRTGRRTEEHHRHRGRHQRRARLRRQRQGGPADARPGGDDALRRRARRGAADLHGLGRAWAISSRPASAGTAATVSVGERLARGETLADILASMHDGGRGRVHGAQRSRPRLQMGIEMPITAEVYRVLYEGKDPRTAVNDLMLRPQRKGKQAANCRLVAHHASSTCVQGMGRHLPRAGGGPAGADPAQGRHRRGRRRISARTHALLAVPDLRPSARAGYAA